MPVAADPQRHSPIGIAVAVLAKNRSLIILSTTRRPERTAVLGVDRVVLHDGEIAPAGVEVALELIGTPTWPYTLRDRHSRRRLLQRGC